MSLLLELGTYASLCALAYVSALVPIVNAELLVVGAAALAGHWQGHALAVAGVVAFGQMVGKATLYWAGRGAAKIPSDRHRKAIARWGDRFSRSALAVQGLVFVSAVVGFPPFYAISLLAGTFLVNLPAFFLVGLAGRFVRFGILALAPGWLAWIRGH